jgi:hypothetical protein
VSPGVRDWGFTVSETEDLTQNPKPGTQNRFQFSFHTTSKISRINIIKNDSRTGRFEGKESGSAVRQAQAPSIVEGIRGSIEEPTVAVSWFTAFERMRLSARESG